jgi:hypothetical protein
MALVKVFLLAFTVEGLGLLQIFKISFISAFPG